MELIIFTNNGNTYIFTGVENLKQTTKGFSFEYTGQTTGVKRLAEFNYTSVAGFAITK
ncbi:hypothetical protein [Gemella massiliensis]|uniref:hypothetical protein n=1 Tax=Gemella massiliensis TaxID=1909670 RepID=UPI000AE6581F|nr:hypothetical protein [Gemella massiliensis]